MPTTPLIQDFLDYLPLFPTEDEDAILVRMRAWANEGLDPAHPGETWVDTREGSHWFISTMPSVREIARLYDLAGTEVPMTASILWTWGPYLDDAATVLDLHRRGATRATGTLRFTGPAGDLIAAGTQVGVLPADPEDAAPLFETTSGGVIPGAGGSTGDLDLPIQAIEMGAASNVPTGAITAASTPLPAGVTVTNLAETSGGSDPETDESLRARVLEQFVGQGAGNALDYKRWAEAIDGVGTATVIPLWAGPGTVLVVVVSPTGTPVSAGIVTAVQTDLDPVPGQGAGQAPIGHTVTVSTATSLAIAVSATVESVSGYSLDGAGGTIATSASISSAITRYLSTIPPGGEVVRAKVIGAIAGVAGVDDVGSVQLNGAALNVALAGGGAPQIAVLGVVTLVEGEP